jgi:hypothetical protein
MHISLTHTCIYVQEHKRKLDDVRKIDRSNADQMALAVKYYARNYECVNFFLANCVLPQDTQQYR